MNKGKGMPPGGAESVRALHEQWRALHEKLNTWPKCSEAELKGAVERMAELESRIARTAASAPGEIGLKLRLLQSGKVQSLTEAALLASAIREVEAMEGDGTA